MVPPDRPALVVGGLSAVLMLLSLGVAAAWAPPAVAQRMGFVIGAQRAGPISAGSFTAFLPGPVGRAWLEATPRLGAARTALRGASRRGGISELQASQHRENKRRRMLRIAELRREMAADVQRLRQRVKQKLEKRTSTADRERPRADDPSSPPHVKGSFSKQEVTKEMKEKTEKSSGKRKSGTINKVRDAQSVLGPLVKERRTSYERRRRMGGSGEVVDSGMKSQRKQWGPKQMIYCPPEMRLTQDLSERQRRMQQAYRLNALVAGNTTRADGEDSRGDDSVDEEVDTADTVFVCRHADRFNPDWHMRMETFAGDGRLPHAQMSKDFPLSELGHRQAADLADYLAAQGVTTVISSPYLRCLETAQHVAWATGAQILVEPGLAEGPGHEPGWLPDLIERYRYFPDIDTLYSPLTEEPRGEVEDMQVLPRCAHVAKQLSPRLQDFARAGGVAVITHASVAIALTALLSLKGGGGEQRDDFSGFSDSGTFAVGDDEGMVPSVDSPEFNRLLEKIDSARPGGAYKLTWSPEEGRWEAGLHCLTHYLEDTGLSGPRTPAWRFTFPTAES